MSLFDYAHGHVQVVGIQGSAMTYNTLEYYAPTGLEAEDAANIALAWETDILGYWLDAVSASWTMLELRATWNYVDTAWHSEFTRSVGAPGTVVGDALPPYNTWSLRKQPDNSNRDPITATPFRQGRIGIAGVPESGQANGLPNASALIYLDALADALKSFTVGATAVYMYIARAAVEPPDFELQFVPILSLSSGKLGTQNTRKS